MSTRTTVIAIVVIVLAALAYYFYATKPADQSALGPQTGTVSQNNLGGQDAMNNHPDPYMTGTWRSTDDAKFTRTFKADGTVTDAYEGDASATDSGTYSVIDPAAETGFPAPVANFSGMTVIKIDFQKAGVMYFGVNSLTDTSLTMTYISGRGNLLSFTRVQ